MKQQHAPVSSIQIASCQSSLRRGHANHHVRTHCTVLNRVNLVPAVDHKLSMGLRAHHRATIASPPLQQDCLGGSAPASRAARMA